jgi:hypothetical protein
MTWRAWLASLTVALLAIAPLLASFHRASVRHALCEHGDFIEPEQAGHRDLSAADRVLSPSALALQADSTATLHGHTHCSVGILARSAVGFVPRAGVVACPLLVAPPEGVDHPFTYVRRILPIAPKTSPPAPRANVLV